MAHCFLIFRMTFTILGSIGEDRIFYRIDANSTFLTGYEDLPISDTYGDERTPAFASIEYRGGILRFAAIEKPVLVEGTKHPHPSAYWADIKFSGPTTFTANREPFDNCFEFLPVCRPSGAADCEFDAQSYPPACRRR